MIPLRSRIQIRVMGGVLGASVYGKPNKHGMLSSEPVCIGTATPLYATVRGDNTMLLASRDEDDAEVYCEVDIPPGLSIPEIIERIAHAVEKHPLLNELAGGRDAP
jgi:hypothetical protein